MVKRFKGLGEFRVISGTYRGVIGSYSQYTGFRDNAPEWRIEWKEHGKTKWRP